MSTVPLSDLAHTIDGQSVGSAESSVVVNPATGQAAGWAPKATAADLDRAFAAADRAFRPWSRDEAERRSGLIACAEAIEHAVDELAVVLVAEQGKPLVDAKQELSGASAWHRYCADLDLPRETVQDDESAMVEVVRRPIGPVAAIAPWNFPIMLAMWKLSPALRVGNTVVLKPSPYTPLTTLRVGELLAKVLPAGVVNVISGDDELGAQMTAHPVARKVSFTGSISTGKAVAVAAARDLKRVTLELGGNDAAVLLDDIDPAKVAHQLFWSAFANNGQICAAVKRVYVPQTLHDAVVDALAAEPHSVVVGDGAEPGTQLGPIQNRPQWERVSGLVSDAVSRGASPAAGGQPLDRAGTFYQPTILAYAEDGMAVVDEEQFGPALPVISYRNLDDAVRAANATRFGLGASVWTEDASRGATVAAELEAGTIWINAHGLVAPHIPFGGVKWSGIGVEGGPWGLYGFTQTHVVYLNR